MTPAVRAPHTEPEPHQRPLMLLLPFRTKPFRASSLQKRHSRLPNRPTGGQSKKSQLLVKSAGSFPAHSQSQQLAQRYLLRCFSWAKSNNCTTLSQDWSLARVFRTRQSQIAASLGPAITIQVGRTSENGTVWFRTVCVSHRSLKEQNVFILPALPNGRLHSHGKRSSTSEKTAAP